MIRTIAALTLASLAGAAYAYRNTEPEFTARGEVLSVSLEERTLTLEDVGDLDGESPMHSGVRRAFLVDGSTVLTAGGNRIELGDVQVGSYANVRYVMDDGTNVARSIEIESPASE
jgi:hypothetical protein